MWKGPYYNAPMSQEGKKMEKKEHNDSKKQTESKTQSQVLSNI